MIELEVPALADRRDDIVPLAHAFLEKSFTLAPDAERALVRHDWPGNVRELQNAIKRACLLSTNPVISAAALNLPTPTAGGPVPEEPEIDRGSIEEALARARGVVAHAARDLGLSRQALYRRMEKLGIKTEPGRSPAAP